MLKYSSSCWEKQTNRQCDTVIPHADMLFYLLESYKTQLNNKAKIRVVVRLYIGC